jgi:hypothetical protein
METLGKAEAMLLTQLRALLTVSFAMSLIGLFYCHRPAPFNAHGFPAAPQACRSV